MSIELVEKLERLESVVQTDSQMRSMELFRYLTSFEQRQVEYAQKR